MKGTFSGCQKGISVLLKEPVEGSPALAGHLYEAAQITAAGGEFTRPCPPLDAGRMDGIGSLEVPAGSVETAQEPAYLQKGSRG